jgi:hypothetical protein
MRIVPIVTVVFVLALMVGPAPADQQQIAPGTGQQNSIVIDTGPDGICNSPAAEGDIQFAALGSGSPNRTEIRCGTNKLVETIATGDDVQLIAFGAACKNANNAVVDTGEDGIANTAVAGDDTQVIVVGVAPANTPCVIAGADGLDFEALLQRIHPAASRVARLASEIPASYVAWDLLAEGTEDLRATPLRERRARLERAVRVDGTIHLTPATTDRALARDWFDRFEGAGLDGVVAKRLDDTYHPGQRAMVKVKHQRTADCVVAGFRWHKDGAGTLVGSLLLGLYDADGVLHHVGIAASFTRARRAELARELEPLRRDALAGHPWQAWRMGESGEQRKPGPRAAGIAARISPGSRSDRARLRGRLRSFAGHALPPRDALPALATRQAAERMPVRSARGAGPVRAR